MRSGTFHHKMSSGMMKFRIGYGYDVHALGEGLPLILGGVEIEHAKGCIAHSDGDVVLHAISDALLGAAALGDIGLHFPDTSDEFKGADSKLLLARCVELLREKGYAGQRRLHDLDAAAQTAPQYRPDARNDRPHDRNRHRRGFRQSDHD